MMDQRVRSTLDGINFVCTTADVWTAHNKSFFGMTVHCIDPSTLQRCKAAICCTRLVGRHTYALASKIESIHHSYSLNGKITATVTDIGSNFVKAFKTFSVTDLTFISAEVTREEYCPEEGHPDEEEATFENVHDTLTLEQQTWMILPK